MFSTLKFTIIEYGTDLASKRVQIIKDIIKKNSGDLITISDCKLF